MHLLVISSPIQLWPQKVLSKWVGDWTSQSRRNAGKWRDPRHPHQPGVEHTRPGHLSWKQEFLMKTQGFGLLCLFNPAVMSNHLTYSTSPHKHILILTVVYRECQVRYTWVLSSTCTDHSLEPYFGHIIRFFWPLWVILNTYWLNGSFRPNFNWCSKRNDAFSPQNWSRVEL